MTAGSAAKAAQSNRPESPPKQFPPPSTKRRSPRVTGGQCFRDSRRRHVERDGALVAVHTEEIGRFARREWRTPRARVVAAADGLDLDDVRAHVAQHLGAQRPGEDAREIEDAYAVQRTFARGGRHRALRLPHRGRRVFVAFQAALYAEQFPDARKWCQFGLTHYADDVRFTECELTLLGWTGRSKGDVRRAWALTDDIERHDTLGMLKSTWALRRTMTAAIIARAGMRDSAQAVLATLAARQRADSTIRGVPLAEAYVRLLLNDRNDAMASLEQYFRSSPAARAQIAQHPWFRPLRGNPRFDALVQPTR